MHQICRRVRDDHRDQPRSIRQENIVAKKGIKGRNVVVELGQKTATKKGYFQSRLCVIGDGQIQLPNMFEQWQYGE